MDLLAYRVPRDRSKWPVTEPMKRHAEMLASEYRKSPESLIARMWRDELGRIGNTLWGAVRNAARLSRALPDFDNGPWEVRNALLVIGEVHWFDEFSGGWFVDDIASEAMSLFAPQVGTESTKEWLGKLYHLLGYGQTQVTEKAAKDLGPGQAIDVVWLRRDFYTSSAEAIELLIDAERTADRKTDSGKQSATVVPENLEVAKLAKKIRQELPKGGTKTDIARDFCDGDERKAQSLLRQLRRYPRLLE